MMAGKIDLGLGDLSDIRPTEGPARSRKEVQEERVAADAVGREHGFTKPATPSAMPRRQKSAYAGEAQHQLSIKGPVPVMARFVEYCDRERLAYWEAVERLMDASENQ